MAKLKVYEIDAIVSTIVEKIKKHNISKVIEPPKKEVDDLRRKYTLMEQAGEGYYKAAEEFHKKYPNHHIQTQSWRVNETILEVNINSYQVDWNVRENIKNQIVMSQITGSDVEKLIESIVKEHTK